MHLNYARQNYDDVMKKNALKQMIAIFHNLFMSVDKKCFLES